MPLRQEPEYRRTVTRRVAAPPEAVWDVVADPGLTAQWSHEVVAAAYDPPLEGRPPRPGDVVVGHMERGTARWTTRSPVVEAERGRRFSFAVSGVEHPTAVWTYDLVPDGDGTQVTYTVVLGDGPSGLDGVPAEQRPAVEQARLDGLARAMARTLDGVAELLEG